MVLVSSEEILSFFILDLPPLVMGEVGISGELIFFFWTYEEGMCESKSGWTTPILFVRSATLV